MKSRLNQSPWLLLVILLLPAATHAQLGKKLREKTKKVSSAVRNPSEFVRSEGVKHLKNSKAKFDSASFGFAIALSDNAGLYENKEMMNDVRDGAILLFERNEEKEPVDVANNYKDMGEMSFAANEYRFAETSFLTSQLVFETNSLEDHVNYSGVIADLGLVNHTMGRMQRAHEYTTRALEKRKDLFGENSMAYAASLNNLAVLQKDMGQYGESEISQGKAISISEALPNRGVPHAIMLNNQALLNQQLGRLETAEKILKESLGISQANQGSKSPSHQRLMTNLAILYQEMGNFEESERILLEVIDLKEKRLGKRHPDYAHMLNNLAALYVMMGKDEKVEELLLAARDIYEKKFGSSHPAYASNVSNLGNFYRYQDRLEEAESLIREALFIRKEVLGENHPHYVQSMEDLAMILWDKHEWDEATTGFELALDKTMNFIESFFPAMSEEEKTRYWDKLQPRFFKYYAFAVEAQEHNPAITTSLLQFRSATKALLLNSSLKIRNTILNSGDDKLIQAYNEWVDTKELLAGYYTYSKEEISIEKINLDSLERMANDRERFLSNESPAFQSSFLQSENTLEEIQNSLATDEAAVEIIQIPVYDRVRTSVNEYYALIITSDQSIPELVDIGSSQVLDDKYFKFYKNSIRLKKEDTHSYNQFWKPLEASLEDKKRLYLSVDGIFNQVSINTLLSEQGYVIDRWEILHITNLNDLAHIKSRPSTELKEKIWLLGSPDFGESPEIPPLPGTKVEVQNANKILESGGYSTKVLLGDEATESNVKTTEPHSIFHFATHGFFLSDTEGYSQERLFGVEPEMAREKPLLRSGLLFSGAGSTFDGMNRKELSFRDNGILTAYEALNLPMEGTELVILSACETGLGEVKAGEGVYGLQRAFLIAGANRIIMSLWKVSDEATQELMVLFYENLVRNSKDIGLAFRNAQLELKEKYPEPYYWGAFVLVEK